MTHDCLAHLEYRERESVERHGLSSGPFERFLDQRYECRECGESYSVEEVIKMLDADKKKPGDEEDDGEEPDEEGE